METVKHSVLIDGMNEVVSKFKEKNILGNYLFYVEDIHFYFYEINPLEITKIELVQNPVGLIIRSKTSTQGLSEFNARIKQITTKQ